MDLFPGLDRDLPTLPNLMKKSSVRPQDLHEEGLDEAVFMPRPPQRVSFATTKRLRVSSVDASLPPPMPVQARPVPDRVSLEDPTVETSTAAILSARLPPRSKPAPYERMTVPEPYPNRLPLTVSLPPERTVPRP
jgi:hypothetical protein